MNSLESPRAQRDLRRELEIADFSHKNSESIAFSHTINSPEATNAGALYIFYELKHVAARQRFERSQMIGDWTQAHENDRITTEIHKINLATMVMDATGGDYSDMIDYLDSVAREVGQGKIKSQNPTQMRDLKFLARCMRRTSEPFIVPSDPWEDALQIDSCDRSRQAA